MARPKTKDEEKAFAAEESAVQSTQKWTPEELLGVKHLGPGIIGQEMYDAAQAYDIKTDGGKFGPAILGIIPDAYKDQTPKK